MTKSLEIWSGIRKGIHGMTKTMTLEELNHVPKGLNNNVLWNMGHVIATQQSMTYRASGLDPHIPKGFGSRFRAGTAPDPENPYTQEEADLIRGLLKSTAERFIEDYRAGKFEETPYDAWDSVIKVKVSNVKEAVQFNVMHESLHLGQIMSLRKLVFHETKQAHA